MNPDNATHLYEAWLRKRIPLIDADLRLKQERMAENPFPFFRATFYRWVQLWPRLCPDLSVAPAVLGVGDLHVENFGTWRDREGRLIWGVNDFDEATTLPYTNDLVRLASSALLAVSANHLACDPKSACDALLGGYQAALRVGGSPFVLAEHHGLLRDLALSELRDPVTYWAKLDQLPTPKGPIPASVKSALVRALPEAGLPFRIVHRRAGLGSLGRRRFVAVADWRGSRVAREAKELTVSAWHWMETGKSFAILYRSILQRAIRVADPFVRVQAHWLLRRLAPDCSRIELGSLPQRRNELKLLEVMGWETANIHLGTKGAARRIAADLKQRAARWLRKAAQTMADATVDDWKAWSRGFRLAQKPAG